MTWNRGVAGRGGARGGRADEMGVLNEGDVAEEAEVDACAESSAPCPTPTTTTPATPSSRSRLSLHNNDVLSSAVRLTALVQKWALALVKEPQRSARSRNRP
jgi:hypothetical protein